jgi:hypothetical protein
METIYIAGPMRGIPEFNFPAFDKVKRLLTRDGWYVISPADIDRKEGFDEKGKTGDEPVPWRLMQKIVHRDLKELINCDAIFMLKGWQNSKGAKAEMAVAQWCEMSVMFECPEDAEAHNTLFIPAVQPAPTENSILETAIKVTSGERRRDYDSATPNHKRIAKLWNSYLGVRKNEANPISPFDVAIMMILLKIARVVHTPTRDGFVDIAGYARCSAQIAGLEEE